MNWMPTESGHELAICEGAIIARNSKGKVLVTVPPAAKKSAVFDHLDALLDFLHSHDAEVGADVERWLLRSLPVPRSLITAVWVDDAWRSWLTDLVITTEDDRLAGFLRGVDDEGLHIVDLDGESTTISAQRVLIAHPAIIPDLDDTREFAVELGITQRLDQLFREVHRPDPTVHAEVTELRDWAHGKFAELRFATGRAASGGFKVAGGYATVTCYCDGREIVARYWIGAGYREDETITGELHWAHGDEVIPVAQVGPVPYSEGVRMAAYIYAGRQVEESNS